MRCGVSWERLVPPIGMCQFDRTVEQRTEIVFCEDGAFVPILKNFPSLQEHDTLHFRWNFVNVVREQQQRLPLSHMPAHQSQLVKRRSQIESARRFVEHKRRWLMH
jgi:hypothetical protein